MLKKSRAAMALLCMKVYMTLHPKQRKQQRRSATLKGNDSFFFNV